MRGDYYVVPPNSAHLRVGTHVGLRPAPAHAALIVGAVGPYSIR